MKVSVLIPVYNGACHLAECLESVLRQDCHDLEILVADDGSQDESPDIIRSFATRDARIRWWKNPRNLGLTANSNACLRAAQGDYLKFVHQDDLLLSTAAINMLAAALDAHPGASLAGSQQHLAGAGSRPLIFSDYGGCFNGRKMIIASLEQNTNLIGQPTLTLFRRQLAQRGFDERFTGFMDFEMWCHLLEQGDFVYLPEAVAAWRVHKQQQTARTTTNPEPDWEHLRFMEIYYAKTWLKAAATDRLLFTQIYYLQKRYGAAAGTLTGAMKSQLTRRRFAWQWLRHKVSRPLEKLCRKFCRR